MAAPNLPEGRKAAHLGCSTLVAKANGLVKQLGHLLVVGMVLPLGP